jgi:hypothetical protein
MLQGWSKMPFSARLCGVGFAALMAAAAFWGVRVLVSH